MANGETVFAYKSKGKMIMDYGNVDYYYGVGTVDKKLKIGYLFDYPFYDFITGYPVLVLNGQPTKNFPGSNDLALTGKKRRTSIGYNKDYIYVICVDDPGATFSELQELFINTYNCDYACNLDGGGSTRMLYGGKAEVVGDGNRPVDNVIAFYLKEEPKPEPVIPEPPKPRTLHRVQVGAYSIKANADKMLLKIKEAGYKDAYVRKINNLYKVQIGAFSIRNNAVNLMKELKAKGFDAFIVTSTD